MSERTRVSVEASSIVYGLANNYRAGYLAGLERAKAMVRSGTINPKRSVDYILGCHEACLEIELAIDAEISKEQPNA